jgi:hypothetical protein
MGFSLDSEEYFAENLTQARRSSASVTKERGENNEQK